MSARLRPAVSGLALAILAVVVGLTACGGGDDDESSIACAESPGSKEEVTIVIVELEDGRQVLARDDCTPLYTNDVDSESRIRCTGPCARAWIPLRVAKGGTLTTQTPVPVAPVAIVERPDGGRQAAIHGMPLYTYSEEGEQGASGDGVTDTFGGTEFSWSVVTPAEAAPGPGDPVPPAGGGLGPAG